MAEQTLQPIEVIHYPEWQPECRAVMLELDPVKVKEKFALAEQAIAARAEQLTTLGDDTERQAMQEEELRMKAALAEIMKQHPELET